MIRIDSLSTHNLAPARKTSENKQADFAAMLLEQAAKTAAESKETLEQDKTSATDFTHAKETVEQNARDELLRILQMSPAERIRYQMLRDMGLTEEALSAMPFDERMKIETMIKEEIERQLAGGIKDPAGLEPVARPSEVI